MTTHLRILTSVSLALIGLIAGPTFAQSDSCAYERFGADRLQDYENDDRWRTRDEIDANPRTYQRYLPVSKRQRLDEREEYLTWPGDDDRLSRSQHDFSWPADRASDRYRPATYERGRATDSPSRRDLRDPFRSPFPRYDDDISFERRYRIPVRDFDDSERGRSSLDFGRGSLSNGHQWMPDDDGRIELNHERYPSGGYEPLTPPLPRRDGNDEAEALSERITIRYQDPVTIRTIRSLSTDQAVRLFREVSDQTDARHLEPSSYDLRVRRALRNLALALENQSATEAFRISRQSFQVDGFRDALSRIWDSMTVRDRSDAEQIMRTVMQHAQQVRGMTPGMVAFEFSNATVDTLDKFSALEPSEPNSGPSASLETEMVGIGVEIKPHDDGLLVTRALRGGPAAEAGLQSGDIITAINQRSIVGMPMAQSVDLIKGQSGSRIQLQLIGSGRNSRSVTLVRRRFRVWTVNDARIIAGSSVGYLNLSQFAQTSTQELDQALHQLHQNGMKSLVLDLRGNPGGLLTTCVQITDRFLPCGTIVSTKGRLASDNMQESATFSRTWDVPLVVLIDGDSASASEILAAAVQDNGRGILVGETSYGKGTVQTHFPLQSISGNLRLTTARFYAPSGRAMSGSGVTPDVRVIDEDGMVNGDRVLDEAVRIAQTRELRERAANSAKCRTRTAPLRRNSFNGDMFDAVQPRTVLR